MSERVCNFCKKAYWTSADDGFTIPKEARKAGLRYSTAVLSKYFCSLRCERKVATFLGWDGKSLSSFMTVMRPLIKSLMNKSFKEFVETLD